MKKAETVYNSKKRKGDKQLGVLFNGGKVRRRREWRGLKDTLYDFGRWLYLWGIMADASVSRGFVQGMFRYRWMANYACTEKRLYPISFRQV